MVISVELGGALIVALVMLLAASQSGQVRRRSDRADGSPAVFDSGDGCDSGSAGDGGCDGGGY